MTKYKFAIIHMINATLFMLIVGFYCMPSGIFGSEPVSCTLESGSGEILLKRSSANDPERSLWLLTGGNKELIWTNKRRSNFSIATNRSSGLSDLSTNQNNTDPDPYERAELVKADLKEETLVVIFRTSLPVDYQTSGPNLAGGFFFDHIFASNRYYSLGFPDLPPHTNFAWTTDQAILKKPNFDTFIAPWHSEKGEYEYFLRSYVRDENGKWQIHVTAVLDVLWADSMRLPLLHLNIEDNNTYSATFEGRYEYIQINVDDRLRDVYQSFADKLKGFTLEFCDVYGEREQLIYRKKVLPGTTVEKIKVVPTAPNEKSSHKVRLFKSVFTTARGSDNFYRLAYEKDYWRRPTSWVDLDELSFETVYRTDPPINDSYDPLFYGSIERAGKYGTLPLGHTPLDSDEVRMTGTLDVDSAITLLEDKIERLSKISDPNPYIAFMLERYKIYLAEIKSKL